MLRTLIGLLLATLTLAGCTSVTMGNGEPPSGRWTVPQAQAHFLAFVGQGNQDLDIVNRLVCTCVGEVDPQQLANACAAVAADDLALAQNLETSPWPEGVTTATEALSAAVKGQAKGYQSCAATSLESMRSHEATSTSTTAQANEVRRVLGLASVGPATMAPRSVVSGPPSANESP